MTIACILRRQTSDIQSEDAFIEGKPLPRTMGKRANKASIMLRIDLDLLDDITREAQAAGLTRPSVFQ